MTRRLATGSRSTDYPSVPPSSRVPSHSLVDAWVQHWAPHLGTTASGRSALTLLSRSLTDGTVETYDSRWRKFSAFCATERLRPLPASPETIYMYLGHLSDEARVAAKSLQSYLSAINTAHTMMGYEAPAVGPVLQAFRRGYDTVVTERMGRTAQRLWLPADIALRALTAGLVERNPRLLRAYVYVALGFAFFQRESTTTAALTSDVHVGDSSDPFITLTERFAKGKNAKREMRTLRIPLNAVPGLADLLRRFAAMRGPPSSKRPAPFFRLPGEKGPIPAARGDDFVKLALSALGVEAPPGFYYSSHSLRKGAATAANSIDVGLIKICHYGNWSSKSDTVHDYIDPSALPSAGARHFFGWLRADSYSAHGPAAL